MKTLHVLGLAVVGVPLWLFDVAPVAAQPVPHVVPPRVAPPPARVRPRPARAAPVPRPPVVAPVAPHPALVPRHLPK